jgi:hypothetical protein
VFASKPHPSIRFAYVRIHFHLSRIIHSECAQLPRILRPRLDYEGLNGFGTSDKNFEVWHPTHREPGKRGLLQAYNYERHADKLDGLSEAEQVERVIGDMEEVHPGLRSNLETIGSEAQRMCGDRKCALSLKRRRS